MKKELKGDFAAGWEMWLWPGGGWKK